MNIFTDPQLTFNREFGASVVGFATITFPCCPEGMEAAKKKN